MWNDDNNRNKDDDVVGWCHGYKQCKARKKQTGKEFFTYSMAPFVIVGVVYAGG